jgi:hypothetical protein
MLDIPRSSKLARPAIHIKLSGGMLYTGLR